MAVSWRHVACSHPVCGNSNVPSIWSLFSETDFHHFSLAFLQSIVTVCITPKSSHAHDDKHETHWCHSYATTIPVSGCSLEPRWCPGRCEVKPFVGFSSFSLIYGISPIFLARFTESNVVWMDRRFHLRVIVYKPSSKVHTQNPRCVSVTLVSLQQSYGISDEDMYWRDRVFIVPLIICNSQVMYWDFLLICKKHVRTPIVPVFTFLVVTFYDTYPV